MSGWLRFENSTAENPKLVALSDRAFRLWFNACCYCSRNETDGLVPQVIVKQLSRTGTNRIIDELIAAGCFEPIDGDRYRIHDYLKHNPSRARLQEMRDAAKQRTSRWRHSDHGDATCDASQNHHPRARDRSVDIPSSLTGATEENREPARERGQHPQAHALSQLLAELIQQRDPNAKVAPDGDGWVREMRLLIADRAGNVAEVERVLRWAQADPFWRSNILSPRKLREKFTQLLLKSESGASVTPIKPERAERQARRLAAMDRLTNGGTA